MNVYVYARVCMCVAVRSCACLSARVCVCGSGEHVYVCVWFVPKQRGVLCFPTINL